MRADVQRFLAGDEESTSVQLPDGSSMTVEKVTGPGAGMRFEGDGGFSGRSYAAAAERPADYPADLPFVADAPVLVQEIAARGIASLFWWNPPDPAGVHASVEKQLLQDGWIRGESQEMPQVGVTTTSYHKGDVERVLLSSAALVSLMEKRP